MVFWYQYKSTDCMSSVGKKIICEYTMLCENYCTTCAPGTTECHRTETKDVQLQKSDAEIERQQRTIQALKVHTL